MAMGAMDTHKYYGGSGSFADRRKTWEDLGLGSAAEYQDTAVQNAQLVSAMNANKGLTLASQSASPAETPAANTAAAASSSSSAQPTVASYASQSQQIAEQLKQLYQQPFNYDPTTDPTYQQLTQRREALGGYNGDPAAIYEQYLAQKNAMGPFKYDYASDPMYQRYAQQYGNAGKRAMEDTLAQVSARTGGLASSYAGAASQQAYNRYMTELDSVIPQLEQIAYSRYRNELNDLGSDLDRQLALENLSYGRYRDTVGDEQWNKTFEFNKSEADRDNDRWWANFNNNNAQWRESFDYQKARDAIDDAFRESQAAQSQENWQKTFDYNVVQDMLAQSNWERNFASQEEQRLFENTITQKKLDYNIKTDQQNLLVELMTKTGYIPTDAELAATGLTRPQADSFRLVYQLAQLAASSKGSGGSSSGSKTTEEKGYGSDYKDVKNTINGMSGTNQQKLETLYGLIADGARVTLVGTKALVAELGLDAAQVKAAQVTLSDAEKFYKNRPEMFLKMFGEKRFREVYGARANEYLKKLNA